jgi:HPt (histidine-containing phosphotransfer) domain-containing protein
MTLSRSASWTALQGRYRASLTTKVDEIDRLTAELGAQPLDERRLDRLADAVHRLAGSAGCLGFDALGQIAAACDARLQGLRGRAIDEGGLLDLKAAVDAMRRECDAASEAA